MPEQLQMNLFDTLSMDSDSAMVLRIIGRHQGRASAITVEIISELTGIAPRQVRDIVKHLIEHHHARIGSALTRPAGYYMIATDDEAAQNELTLRRLALSILTRAAVLKNLTVQEYMRRLQCELPL